MLQHIFIKLSSIVRTDVSYVTSGGFWLMLGQLSSSVSSFLLTVAFANLVSLETFGTYKFFIAVVAFISIPTLSGINTSLIRAIAQKFEGNIKESLKLKLQWGAFSFLIGIGVALFYFFQENIVLAQCFLIAAVFIPFMELASIHSAILLGRKEFGKNTKLETVLYFFVAFGQILVLFLTENILVILFSYFVLWTIGRFTLLRIVLKQYPQTNNDVSHESLTLGKHLSLMKVMNTVASNIDRIIMFSFLGPISVALYSIAIAPVQQIKGASGIIKTLSLPKFSENDRLTFESYLRKMLLMTLVLAVVALIYIVLSPIFYTMIFPKYLDAILYSQILSISIISFGSMLNGSILIAKNAKRMLYTQTTVTYAVQIVLVVGGVIFFDIMGAVIAFVLSQLFYFFFSSFHVIRLLKK